jgi:hypothetical protein
VIVECTCNNSIRIEVQVACGGQCSTRI